MLRTVDWLANRIRSLAQAKTESMCEPAPSVQFVVSIPAPPEEMQIYKLEPAKVPLEFVNEKLRDNKMPALKLEQKGYTPCDESGQEDRGWVRAFVDPARGELHFLPNFAELIHSEESNQHDVEALQRRAQSVARAAFADERFIPRDATQLGVAEPITVKGGVISREVSCEMPSSRESRVVLTIVPAIRYASGFRVYGRGSHAVVSVANDGSIVGALRRWRTAQPGRHMRVTISAEEVRERIERKLRPVIAARGSRAIVDKIAVAYYDANAKYLQPVYYFEAALERGAERRSDIKIVGYIPMGKALEPIPDLASPPSGEKPEKPKQTSLASAPACHVRLAEAGS